jgi:hypothetical protein
MKIWFIIGCSFERAALIGWELGSAFDDANSEPAPHLEPFVRTAFPIIGNRGESAFLALFALKAKPSALVACGHGKAPVKRIEPARGFSPFGAGIGYRRASYRDSALFFASLGGSG